MIIDCFIMNPPYNGPGQQNFICRRITKVIKNLKPQKYIRTTLPSRYMYNRLWEIYNERGNK